MNFFLGYIMGGLCLILVASFSINGRLNDCSKKYNVYKCEQHITYTPVGKSNE